MNRLALGILLSVSAQALAQTPNSWTIPGTVNIEGLNGTRFVSDLALTNPGNVSAHVTISFIPVNAIPVNGTTPRQVMLSAGGTVVYRNLLDGLWGAQGAAGATLVASDVPLLIRARTYNTAASGTYGVALPVFANDRLLSLGDRADSLWISQSANASTGYRTNVAVVFPDDGGGAAIVTIYDADGNQVGTRDYGLDAPGFQQFSVSSFAGAVPVGRAEIAVTRGRAAGYSVVNDNVTGDSSLFTFEDLPAGYQDVLVNGVARANGKNGTFFRTDGRFYNPATTDATVTVAFHANLDSNPSPVTRDFIVPAGKIIDIVDVLDSLLALPVGSSGALRFSSRFPVAILCRTSNVDPTGAKPGTFGAQQKPTQLLSFLMSADAGAVVTGIRQNASTDVGFRTNVGFAAGKDGASYALTLKTATGETVATSAASLGPYGWTQPNVKILFPGTTIPDDATLLVKVTSGSVDVFDSSIDNASGDSVVTPIMPLPVDIPSAATIGPLGGSIRSSDGRLTLKVPAGALSSPADMSFGAALSDAPNGIGPGYLLTVPPEVAGRALLVLAYGAYEIAGSGSEALSIAFKGGDGWYIGMGGTLDPASRKLTLPLLSISPPGSPSERAPRSPFNINNFTMSILRAWTIVPEEATVRTNGQATFRAYFVGPPTTYRDPVLNYFMRASDPYNVNVEWRAGDGTPEFGTITPQGINGIYTAPCRVPHQNPFSVFYRIKDSRIPFSPVATHIAIVHIIPSFRRGEIGLADNTCGPAPVWEGTINQSFHSTGFGQTTSITNTASVTFEFDDTAQAQPDQVIYRLRSGSYTYNLLYVSDKPCQTVTTSSGPLPTAPYMPGVLGTTGAGLVFLTGTIPAHYLASGDSIVLFTQTTNCDTFPPQDVTTIFPGDHFWWLQSDGDVSLDGKTIQGSRDQPDGLGGTLHWDWLLTIKE
jgi:hypothetical protein